jgi:hypothetical protein
MAVLRRKTLRKRKTARYCAGKVCDGVKPCGIALEKFATASNRAGERRQPFI